MPYNKDDINRLNDLVDTIYAFQKEATMDGKKKQLHAIVSTVYNMSPIGGEIKRSTEGSPDFLNTRVPWSLLEGVAKGIEPPIESATEKNAHIENVIKLFDNKPMLDHLKKSIQDMAIEFNSPAPNPSLPKMPAKSKAAARAEATAMQTIYKPLKDICILNSGPIIDDIRHMINESMDTNSFNTETTRGREYIADTIMKISRNSNEIAPEIRDKAKPMFSMLARAALPVAHRPDSLIHRDNMDFATNETQLFRNIQLNDLGKLDSAFEALRNAKPHDPAIAIPELPELQRMSDINSKYSNRGPGAYIDPTIVRDRELIGIYARYNKTAEIAAAAKNDLLPERSNLVAKLTVWTKDFPIDRTEVELKKICRTLVEMVGKQDIGSHSQQDLDTIKEIMKNYVPKNEGAESMAAITTAVNTNSKVDPSAKDNYKNMPEEQKKQHAIHIAMALSAEAADYIGNSIVVGRLNARHEKMEKIMTNAKHLPLAERLGEMLGISNRLIDISKDKENENNPLLVKEKSLLIMSYGQHARMINEFKTAVEASDYKKSLPSLQHDKELLDVVIPPKDLSAQHNKAVPNAAIPPAVTASSSDDKTEEKNPLSLHLKETQENRGRLAHPTAPVDTQLINQMAAAITENHQLLKDSLSKIRAHQDNMIPINSPDLIIQNSSEIVGFNTLYNHKLKTKLGEENPSNPASDIPTMIKEKLAARQGLSDPNVNYREMFDKVVDKLADHMGLADRTDAMRKGREKGDALATDHIREDSKTVINNMASKSNNELKQHQNDEQLERGNTLRPEILKGTTLKGTGHMTRLKREDDTRGTQLLQHDALMKQILEGTPLKGTGNMTPVTHNNSGTGNLPSPVTPQHVGSKGVSREV